ncbi:MULTISPECIES: molybdate ABC transporter permease subunit [Alteromonadaceae]|uniref:molybdate ABC transporter permease subunit n=1 Tax=Alteromonadaceae TaxID=72275 RepID=UPI001C08486E|nr:MULTISPECIES: molybdate ABC transporter permease subunit [Aliiglaciecola]MBU2878296.1 molybdate ABC transporter permease subunit [Aliiglaciecola lipolytica]MDO6711792.1 molybdate ABC transporter permease subunit [Aliiglaciecola sp. 2_MG-2023]MDO6753034.1 molybdate ABC transporter permease subunit [Aliiglaciecola sp. 1_MG-2023]
MMLSETDLIAFWLTIKLALISTVLLLVIGFPLSFWLAKSKWRYKFIFEALVALPLVLPPTVLGFYLLILMSPNGVLGEISNALGTGNLAFSFTGLIIGSCIYSLPFVIQPLQTAFVNLQQRPLDVAATLGASKSERLFRIIIPLLKPGIISAAVLGFAHTLGEFGVVLMIGGNIPGQTQVVSIAIYEHVESLEYQQAHWLAGTLLLFSFVLLLIVYATNKGFKVVNK